MLEGYTELLNFELNGVFPFARTKGGKTDLDTRNEIRSKTEQDLKNINRIYKEFAFTIRVWKCGNRLVDLDNVTKPILDSFAIKQWNKDGHPNPDLGLYLDDGLDNVVEVHLYGERSDDIK